MFQSGKVKDWSVSINGYDASHVYTVYVKP